MRFAIGMGLLALSAQAIAQPEGADPIQQLSRLSLSELGDVEVTSVSKAAERLESAAASIFVITRDDILRSGAVSVAEALRLAPNLQVIRLTSSSYAIGARGFGGDQAAQNFPNKLLMLIDGRSTYSPLFSGIYFDSQDVLLNDVDRIEVISGPGATLWGANAMNGVINVITRKASATTGTVVRALGGNSEQGVEARYGANAGDALAYRVYAKGFKRAALELQDGATVGDSWKKGQAGFRLDWTGGADVLTASGDVYRAEQDIPVAAADGEIKGTNLLTRWQRSGERSQLQVQAFFDRTERESSADSSGFVLNTYDLEIQQSLDFGRHRVVWGAGKRVSRYDIRNTASLLFVPARRTLNLANVFAQDAIDLGGNVRLTAGIKLEDDPYSGWTTLPDLRLSWAITQEMLVWASGSRAIRSPTPFDVDVVEKVGSVVFLQGNPQFRAEEVMAYELGYRVQPNPSLSITVAGFYNVYDDLRTIELDATSGFLPLRWDNRMRGDTYGVEAWANVQIAPWWRVSPGVRTLHKRLRFDSDASRLLGLGQAGNDPTNQASLRSTMDFAARGTFDLQFRHTDELPAPDTRGYYELAARVGWRISDEVEIGVSGSDLLHRRHVEYAAPAGEYIGRSVLAEIRWTN